MAKYRLDEENSELRKKRFPIGDGIRKHLRRLLATYEGDKTLLGYKRLNNLVSAKYISYFDLKRIKNFFDNYLGTKKSDEYNLNGGDEMKWWVENTLRTARKSVDDSKRLKKESGIDNAYIRPHEKRRQTKKKNRPTGVKFRTTNRNLLNNKTLRYENILREMKENNNYTHFAVNKNTGLIVNGWDYSDIDTDDLRNFKRDYFTVDLEDYGFNPKDYKILGRKTLERMGIDVNDEANNWSNNGEIPCKEEYAQTKMKESITRDVKSILENMICDSDTTEYDGIDPLELSEFLENMGWCYVSSNDVINRTTKQTGVRYDCERSRGKTTMEEVMDAITKKYGDKVVCSIGQHRYAPEIKRLSIVALD